MEEKVSDIDGVLQDSVEAILEKHLVEYDAMDGVAIVMETEAGMIRARAGLNTGKVKPDDKFDSGVGIYAFGNDTVFDHNWRKGGYMSE